MILKKISIHSFCDNYKREKITQYEYNVGSFAFELYDSKENPVNLSDCKSAAYYGTKADGTLIGNECEIADNKVIITPTLQMTACAGLLKGIIECQFESGNIRFYGIDFDILPAPVKAEIESTDEFTVLDKTLAEVRELLAKAENGEFNGTDGIGITKSEINSNGELVLTYSDNTVSNLGVVVGADGKDGQDGVNGADGSGYVLTEEDKTEIANAALEDINTTLSGKADKATTLEGYGITDTYSKTETNNALANKADLVQSKNIFDFDKWAECLQSLSPPVYNGTLDDIDFDKKSITFTATEAGSFTRGWTNDQPDMRIALKANTTYTFSWSFESSSQTQVYIFFNGINTAQTRLSKDGAIGYVTFTTLADTSYITIRFDSVTTSTVTVSDIMIEEAAEKSLLYIPNQVAEGVKELTQSTEIALAEIRAQIQQILNIES